MQVRWVKALAISSLLMGILAHTALTQDLGLQANDQAIPGLTNTGVTGAEPAFEATPEFEATPSIPPRPRKGRLGVRGTIGCVHTQPGVQSEVRGFLQVFNVG